jgi:chromosome segregation ATPase
LQRQVKDLGSSSEDHSSKLSGLEVSVGASRKNSTQQEKQIKTLEAISFNKSNEVQDLKRQITAVESCISDIDDVHTRRIDQLESALSRLKKDNEELQAENTRLLNEFRKALAHCVQFAADVDMLEKRLDHSGIR